MNKQELEDIVRETYGMYNKDLFEVDRQHIMRGWWAVLKDLPADEVRKTITTIATREKFLPPAGQIRNAHLETRIENPPPTPQQFWGHILTVNKNLNTVTRTESPKKIAEHPCVKNTMEELGTAMLGVSTNGDRTFVLEAYTRHTTTYLEQQTVVESNET